MSGRTMGASGGMSKKEKLNYLGTVKHGLENIYIWSNRKHGGGHQEGWTQRRPSGTSRRGKFKLLLGGSHFFLRIIGFGSLCF